MLTAILLSFVMTFTVETKSKVEGTGTFPSFDMEASYNCTYQKGSVRAGDTATLSLEGLGGIEIESVVMYLKSNKSAGSGEIHVYADGEKAAEKSGSYKDWFGAYSTEYQPLTVLSNYTKSVESLSVEMIGTVNSLHVEKYVITYQAAPTHAVSLRIGNDTYGVLTEEYGGAGVLLPSLPDRDTMHFVGWSETEFWTVSELPDIYYAGERFYPKEDGVIWSVWQYGFPDEDAYVTDLQSGLYLYANRQAGIALAGVPQDGIMAYGVLDVTDVNQVYYVDFLAPDTATIQHVLTDTYIGFSGKNMSAARSKWLVYHQGDQTLFYTVINNKQYVLWLNIQDNYGNMYAGLMEAKVGESPLGLRHPRINGGEQLYTCHPESRMAVESVSADGRERIITFGIYELHIKDGKKYLRIVH